MGMNQSLLSQFQRITRVVSLVSLGSFAAAENPPRMLTGESLAENSRDATILLAQNNPSPRADAEASDPLIAAVEKGDTDRVRKLLNRGTDFDVRNAQGETPLMIAVSGGQVDLVRMLIRIGADVDLRNDHGSAFTLAVEKGDATLANLLLAGQADVDIRDSQRRTPLMSVARSGNIEMAKFLLEKGAEADAADRNGWTALRYAAKEGHAGMVDAILARTKDVESPRVRRALAEAVDGNHDEAVKTFRNHGVETLTKKPAAAKPSQIVKKGKSNASRGNP